MKYMKYALLAVSCFLMVQCTEEGDKTYPIKPTPGWTVVAEDVVQEAPHWQEVLPSTTDAPGWKASFASDVQQPQWTNPDKTIYPTSMTAVVRLTPILESLSDDADMMAAFIDGECRGVAEKVTNDGVRLFFIHVKAPSSESGNVEFRYYSAANKRVYTSPSADVSYEIDKIYGTADSPAYPDFEQSGPFPVTTKAWVKVDKTQLPFEVNSGDELQAFVDGECRGIKHVVSGDDMLFWFDLLGKEVGEKVSFRYYSAATKSVYLSEQTTLIGERSSVVGSADEPLTLSFVPQGSMTAYVSLDAPVASYADAMADEVAAFVGGQCAGKGQLVGRVNDRPVYKIVINSVDAQTTDIDVRYYCSRYNYIFTAPHCLTFVDGKVEASQEQPFALPLVTSGKHPLTMKACIALPSDIARHATQQDMMAAFVGNECRGLATVNVKDGVVMFEMSINGGMEVAEKVTLQYYSVANSYLYQTIGSFDFVDGGHYGTMTEPCVPQFVVVE